MHTTETSLTRLRFTSQVQWSNDDLLATEDANQNMPCGTFFANLCSFDSDTLLQLVDLPPGAPPPPISPDGALQLLTVERVMGKGGLVNLTTHTAKTHCTDNEQTQCIATSYEQPVRYARTRPHPNPRPPLLTHAKLTTVVCRDTFAVDHVRPWQAV